MSIRSRLSAIEATLGNDERCHGCGYPGTAAPTGGWCYIDARSMVSGCCEYCGRLLDLDGRPHGQCWTMIVPADDENERGPVEITDDIIERHAGDGGVKVYRGIDWDAAI